MNPKYDYYCSEKFTWLSVDLEKRQAYSCCAAAPSKVNIEWLKQNPGQLFNTPDLLQERQDMLNNVPVESCRGPCWQAEENNLPSRRMGIKKQDKTYTNIRVDSPKQLHVLLGSACNLTCVYCCKQYSSAWLRDIDKNGPYIDNDRFTLNELDKILLNIGQREHQDSSGFETLISEIQKFREIEEISISGGEPFLYNSFPEFLNNLPTTKKIKVFTGMGVDPKRFRTQLGKITNKQNLLMTVSGENCGKLYELVRYGNTWNNFLINLQELKNQNFNFRFSITLSNLTAFGICDFMSMFSNCDFRYDFCNEPPFLAVNVLDDLSKDKLSKQIESQSISFGKDLITAINQPCTQAQQADLKIYLQKFVKYRNLDMTIFPDHFCSWLKL